MNNDKDKRKDIRQMSVTAYSFGSAGYTDRSVIMERRHSSESSQQQKIPDKRGGCFFLSRGN